MSDPNLPAGVTQADIDSIGEPAFGVEIDVCSTCNGFGILMGNVRCGNCDGEGKIDE